VVGWVTVLGNGVIREALLGNVFVVSGMRKETGRPVIASIQTEPTGNAGKSRGEARERPLSV
jgi:hypothetical protein